MSKTDGAGNRRAFRVTVIPTPSPYSGEFPPGCDAMKKELCRGSAYRVELDLDPGVVLTLCRAHIRELHAATADV